MATETQRALGTARSPHWHEVEKTHLAKEGWCRNCGGTQLLQVHHMMPFHLDPAKELDPTNLITLCEDFHDGVECHLHVGHLGNWHNFNPAIASVANSPRAGVPAMHLLIAAAPQAMMQSAPVPAVMSTTTIPESPTAHV